MAPETPPCSVRHNFGFATIALTSTILCYALRDVALVLITSAGLAPPAEGRACLCKQGELARMSERYKEENRIDHGIRGS